MTPSPAPTPKLVLCVDDELVGLSVRRTLLEHAGYKVLTALSGPEGLALFQREPVDAVILDYFMPGMRGPEVALQMRACKPAVPILLLSAHLGLSESLCSLVDGYISKGGTPSELLKTLNSLVEAAPTATGQIP
jgi:CheY-like chemotaxis protein